MLLKGWGQGDQSSTLAQDLECTRLENPGNKESLGEVRFWNFSVGLCNLTSSEQHQ